MGGGMRFGACHRNRGTAVCGYASACKSKGVCIYGQCQIFFDNSILQHHTWILQDIIRSFFQFPFSCLQADFQITETIYRRLAKVHLHHTIHR